MESLIYEAKHKSKDQETIDEIEDRADQVKCDMDIIHESLRALDKDMQTCLFMGQQESITFLDIMIYNELHQALIVYNHYKKNSKSQLFQEIIRENPDTTDTHELMEYSNVERWYNRTVHTDPDVSKILKSYNSKLLQEFEDRLA